MRRLLTGCLLVVLVLTAFLSIAILILAWYHPNIEMTQAVIMAVTGLIASLVVLGIVFGGGLLTGRRNPFN